jgi:hypothetical protein
MIRRGMTRMPPFVDIGDANDLGAQKFIGPLYMAAELMT